MKVRMNVCMYSSDVMFFDELPRNPTSGNLRANCCFAASFVLHIVVFVVC